MKSLYKIVWVFSMFFFSCKYTNDNNECKTFYYKNLKEMSNKLVSNISDNTKYLYDIGSEERQGVYSFHSNNTLRDYTFFQKKNNYSYTEIYKSNGELDSTLGHPIFWMPYSEIGEDSIEMGINIFDFNKEIIDFKVSINGLDYKNINLKSDTVFSNMKRADIFFSVSKQESIKVFYQCKLKFCNQDLKVFKDSIFFNRKG